MQVLVSSTCICIHLFSVGTCVFICINIGVNGLDHVCWNVLINNGGMNPVTDSRLYSLQKMS